MATQTRFLFRPTGKTRTITPEFGAATVLPEVELVKEFPTPEASSFSGIAEVEGHGFFYCYEAAYEYDGGKPAVLLTRTVAAFDAGDNKINERTAPSGTMGIAAPPWRGSPPLTAVHGKPSFAAIPGDYTGVLDI